MNAIDRAAYVSVGRACGFGALAIVCFMVGLSFDPVLAARSGGIMALFMTGILVLKAVWTRRQSYKRTEAWLILGELDRPPPQSAQTLIGSALRRAYYWYAKLVASVSVILFSATIVLAGLEG